MIFIIISIIVAIASLFFMAAGIFFISRAVIRKFADTSQSEDMSEDNIAQNLSEGKTDTSTNKSFTVGGDSAPVPTKKEKKKGKTENEYFIASKILPSVGVFSIIIGVGFFLKDFFNITDTFKVIFGFALGLAFILVGDKIREKYLTFSTFVMGCGFAILYLSAKFGLVFELYTSAFAFILMVFMTVAAVATSHVLNSRVLAFVSLVGGFISPVLASSGQANEVVLFGYISILLGGILFLS